MAMIGLLAAPAFQDRLFANPAAPMVELLKAILGAKRVVLVVSRDRQLRPAPLIPAADSQCAIAHSPPAIA